MGKLRELLKADAERYRHERTKRQQALEEWLDLLNGLFKQIDAWLKASDPDGLLEVTADPMVINDPALGEYRAPMRRITLGDKTVDIVPRARYVATTIQPPGEKSIRAHGLVEIRYLGWTSYELYQLPPSNWYIRATTQNLRESGNAVEPLDADRFEAALASLLQ